MPNISIIYNKEKDLQLFDNYLFNEKSLKQFPHVRQGIMNTFKSLAEQINSTTDLDKQYDFLKNFINNLYLKHEENLILILKHLVWIFTQANNTIFQWLEKTMDFNCFKSEYILRLSFLTNSTFNSNWANISILREIGNIWQTPFIDIFLHEISHTIFEIKTHHLYEKLWKLTDTWHYFLKELIAPIVIRDKIFDLIRQSNDLKFANTWQQLLFFNINWEDINALEYLDKIFINQKNQWLWFNEILIDFYNLFKKIEIQLEEKKELFNKLHKQANIHMNSQKFKDILIENWYCKGIKI